MPENTEQPNTNLPRHSSIETLETYAGDMADALKEGQGSVIKIALAEDERRQKERAEKSIKSPRNLVFTLLGIILILLALGAVFTLYHFSHLQQPITDNSTETQNSIIFADSSVPIDLTNLTHDQSIAAVTAAISAANPDPGKIINFYLTTEQNGVPTPLGINDFMTLIGPSASPVLVRSLDPEFMIGVYGGNTKDLFILLDSASFDTTFANMLTWEGGMATDLSALFGLQTTDPSLLAKPFSDKVVDNINTRVLTDSSGTTALLYSFINTKTFVITSNEELIPELVTRLLTEQAAQ